MNEKKHKSIPGDSQRGYSRRRILWLSAIVGACVVIAVGMLVSLVCVAQDANGASACPLFEKLVFLVLKPCGWIINWLVRGNIIQKHDGIAVIAVFIVYFALIGATLGVAFGMAICGLKNRRGSDRTDKEKTQATLPEGPQEEPDGGGTDGPLPPQG